MQIYKYIYINNLLSFDLLPIYSFFIQEYL